MAHGDARSVADDCVYRLADILRGEVVLPWEEPAVTALNDVAHWLDGYISRPHPQLGRSGDVCPWTRRAAELGALSLTVCLSQEPAQVDALLLGLMRRFLTSQSSETNGLFRSIVTVFPRHGLEIESFIVATHARLKPRFLAERLMLGEFYPGCEKPGLRNPQFRPLRSPWTLLVIRPMVEGDIEFLTDRDEFVAAYLDAQGPRGRDRLRQLLRERPGVIEPERLDGIARMLAAV